jgi:flavin-dependent thymidylate synthase
MTNIHSTRYISSTPEAEKLIAYCARVSSPNQQNEQISKLLGYCIKHGHWSIFEMASIVLEITTTRAIEPQILRHKSFSFQSHSFRYSSNVDDGRTNPLPSLASSASNIDFRVQDTKNRQNSLDVGDIQFLDLLQRGERLAAASQRLYEDCLERGIALEVARNYLPMLQPTRLYMSGTLRSWIHYFKVRLALGTQKEHRLIAESAYSVFQTQFPIISQSIEEYLRNS